MRTKFSDDRGALINALVFVTVGFLLTSLMTGWMMTRISADHVQAQEAQSRSAVDEYAQEILEKVNANGPTSVKAQAGSGETGTKDYASLRAHVELDSWKTPAADGTIVAKITAKSSLPNPMAKPITVTVRYTLVGAGNYLGVGSNGRPMWTKVGGTTDPTALWQIDPVKP